MGNDAIFGRYWAADSIVHKLDPRTKLVGMAALVVTLLMVRSASALALVAVFVAAAFGLARIPALQALRSIAPLAFIVVLSALFNLFFVQDGRVLLDWGWLVITQGGVSSCCFMAVRLTVLLLAGSLLTLATTSIDITEAFERILTPLSRFGVPAHEFSLVLGIALRFVPQFVDELRTIRIAQASRGAQLATSSVKGGIAGIVSLLVPLLASAFRHAETLASAMDARCYHGASGRTRLAPLSFGKPDLLAALALALVFCGVLALNSLA